MILYKTTNTINNKIYIGVHNNTNLDYIGSGKVLKQAIKKYGKEHFIREILLECDSAEEAYALEECIVDQRFCNRTDTYNIALGGGGTNNVNRKGVNNGFHGKHHSIETRKAISEANKGKREPLSATHKQKISESKSGHLNHMYGKKHTDETKAKMAQSRKNLSLEQRTNISEAAKNRTKIECEHCGKVTSPGNYTRWHGDKCKSKNLK